MPVAVAGSVAGASAGAGAVSAAGIGKDAEDDGDLCGVTSPGENTRARLAQ